MNIKKYMPTLVCGFSAAVLSTVPGIKNFSCCLIVPGAAVFSIMLDKRINNSNEKIQLGKAIGFGFLTGLVATIFITTFEMLLTFFTRSNDIVQSLPEVENMMRDLKMGQMMTESIKIMKSMAKEIQTNGFSFIYLFMILSSNIIINSVFGMIGGVLGMSLSNRNVKEDNTEL